MLFNYIVPNRTKKSFRLPRSLVYVVLLFLLTLVPTFNTVLSMEFTNTGLWSDPDTWGGTVPAVGATVVIPDDTEVLVDVAVINVDSITVPENSALRFTDVDTTVRVRFIDVIGALHMGFGGQPLENSVTFDFYDIPLDLPVINTTTNLFSPLVINLPVELTGIDLDLSTLLLVEQPTSGTVSITDSVTGLLEYVPDGSFLGTTSFTYSICDTATACGFGVINIEVTEPVIEVSGDLMQWHRVSVTFDGPQGSEADEATFWDYRLMVTFTNGQTSYTVPGFFAADGNAANTGATIGNKWRVHFTPDAVGEWTYTASFRTGDQIAISLDPNEGTPTSFNGATGTFNVTASTAPETDFRYHGTLRYVDGHHFQFAGSGEYYLKGGADSPENFLGYSGFDGTFDTGGIIDDFLHDYEEHIMDWQVGDPTWGADERGKGIIGAINYLSSQGINSIYFITYNIDNGDGEDTWPWTSPDDRETFDISKLDQWEIVFSHMTQQGIQLHFLTQELENDEELGGNGDLNPIRQLYYREMIARFSHHPVLQWNLGEENQNTDEQLFDFSSYIRSFDPYNHPIVVHAFYDQPDDMYDTLVGDPNFEATSIQGSANKYNEYAIEWRENSANAGRPWAIYGDEQGPAVHENMDNVDQLREDALWGNLMGGGAGVEWYFGYQGDNFGDVQQEDFRLAQPIWEDTDHALDFFQNYLPFWEMTPDNSLVDDGYALAKVGEIYAVYLDDGGSTSLELANEGIYDVFWYNPREGGPLQVGTVAQVTGPGEQDLGDAPEDTNEDWAILVTLNTQNYAPNIEPIANQTVAIGNSLDIPVSASDINGDTLTLEVSIVGLNTGVAADPATFIYSFTDNGDGTGTLSLMPQRGKSGNYTVTVTASDGEETSEIQFNLAVPPNPAPIIDPILDQIAQVDFNLQIPVNVTDDAIVTIGFQVWDKDGNVVPAASPLYTATDNGDNTGTIVFSAVEADIAASPYTVTVTAIDDYDKIDTESFDVDVTIVNDPPVVEDIDNQSNLEGTEVSLQVVATDSDPLTYDATGLPDGLTIDANGLISGTLTATPATYAVVVSVSDTANPPVTVEFSWTVTPQFGVISFTLVDADADVPIAAYDPIPEGAVINLFNLPENLDIVANTNPNPIDGSVSFNLNDGQNTTTEGVAPYTLGGDNNGNYYGTDIPLGDNTLTATPSEGDALTLNFTVIDQEGNQPPTANAGADITVEDSDDDGSEIVTLNGSASTDDIAVTSYVWTNGNGVQIGTTASIDVLVAADTTAVFTLTVSDAEGESDSDTVSVTVNAPPPNQAPVADAGADITVEDSDDNGSEIVTLDGSASSDDEAITSYLWTDANGVEVGTTVTVDILVAVDTTETFTLTVFDAEGDSDSDTVSVTVNAPPPNPAPVLDPISDQTDAEGTAVNLQVVATDNDPLTYDATGLPDGLSINADGLISGTITADPDTYTVTVSVSDNINPAVTVSFDWTITEAPQNGVVSFTLVDADANEPIAEFDPIPEGATLNLADLPDDLAIIANTNPDPIDNGVSFNLNDGDVTQKENVSPYALGGDNGGDYYGFDLPLGENTLTATTDEGSLTLNFTVIDE